MSVAFTAIPDHGLQIAMTDMSWFPEDIIMRTGDVSTELVLQKKGASKVELRGKIEVKVSLQCDRCLDDFEYTINSPIQLIMEVMDSTQKWHVQDLELSEADIETIVLSEPVVPIGDILREQVLLSLPEKSICRDECLGFCNRCGKKIIDESCRCRQEDVNSPFAVLAKYKKK